MIRHYSNKIQNEIQKELFNAKSSIRIAVAWFTNELLFQPLLMKSQLGIHVELISNFDEINMSSSNKIAFKQLEDAGGIVHWNKTNKLMHDKFCIIDDRIVITGSYNWTNKAEDNDESISISYDEEETITFYKQRFSILTEKYSHNKKVSSIRSIAHTMVEKVFLPFISNGKVGLREKSGGAITIAAVYDMIYGCHDGMYRFRKSGMYGFLNSEGIEIIPAKYKDAKDFSEGLAGVLVDDEHWGYINKNDILSIDAIFSSVRDFHDGMAFVEILGENVMREDEYFGKLIDSNGTFISIDDGTSISNEIYGSVWNMDRRAYVYSGRVVHDFHNGVAIIEDIGLYAAHEVFTSQYVLTKEGKQIPNPRQEYSEEDSIKEFQKKNPEYDPATAEHDEWGYEPHEGFKVYGDFGEFHNGIHKACIESYFGAYNTIYPELYEVEGYGYVDLDNKVALPFDYEETHDFKGGRYRVKTKYNSKTNTGGKYGYLNEDLKLCIPYLYDEARDFHEGLAAVGVITETTRKDLIVEEHYKYGFINENGACVIELKYSSVGDFVNGLAPACETEGKWGFINKKGEMVIPPQFSLASNFYNGIAHIRIGNTKGFVDTFGNILITDEQLLAPWY